MKKTINMLSAAVVLLLSGIISEANAQYCVSGACNPNTYVNSVDPNTIEYDNMVSVFHSTIVRESSGLVKVWGQGIAQNGSGTNGNVAPPQELNGTNYGTGTNQLSGTILKFAGGSNTNSQQFAVLTTNGLYVWGDSTVMIPNVANVANGQFRKVTVNSKADGLPTGVSPDDIKMMFGTRGALAIVTCTGAAYVLSANGNLYSDGAADTNANDLLWHRVSTAANTPLTNVVAVRGTYQALMALTATGEIYTWGNGTRLGNNTAASNRSFATLMSKPTGVTPKMIGMTTGSSYYLLGTNNQLYALGENGDRQLGDGTTTDRNSWVTVAATNTISGTTYTLGANVVWISPQEHEGGTNYAAINVLTTDGKLWAWGSNDSGMIGGGSGSSNLNPTYMPGKTTGAYDATKLNIDDKIIAVETGGHTTLTVKQCTTRFGYVGHKIRGSMSNNTSDNGTEQTYTFGATSTLAICGAITAPDVLNLKICQGLTANLANAEPAALPIGVSGIKWWTDEAATIPVSNPAAVGPGTYYATFDGLALAAPCVSSITVSYLEPGDSGYDDCSSACYKPGLTDAGNTYPTKVGITALSRAGAGNTDNWPMVRQSGWIALEAKTKGFVPNRVAFDTAGNPVGIATTNFVEGMMVYDTTNKCMKIYTLKEGDTAMAWHCMTTQACPD
ncbi:hypothetical protein AAH994_12090 [Weeksellaceae bacterium A-14]